MTEPFKKREQEYFYIKEWTNQNPQLIAGFTTIHGGYSKGSYESLNCGFHVGDQLENVRKNRQHLSRILDFPMNTWVGAEQTHGSNIIEISKNHKGHGSMEYASSLLDTDGLYTSLEDTFLTLCFADCVPLYFYSHKHRFIGLAHAGWKGTVKGIAKEMIQKWNSKGIDNKDIYVAIGPSICETCYIVDDRVMKEAKVWLNESNNQPYHEISTGQYHLNLRELNKIILEKSGISSENIFITQLCTSCGDKEFFSHRRDQGCTGRMLGFIGLKGIDKSEG